MKKRIITPQDIIPTADYLKIRASKRMEMVAWKKNRRCEIGPVATCLFESFETMLYQVQEMLAIEKGGDEQLVDELAAYNPMIPQGKELTATVMFEIDDPYRRSKFLEKLGGIEETLFIQFGEHKIFASPETDVDRTSADGKASSVHFVHFHFNDEQIAQFPIASQVMLGFTHPQYPHLMVIPDHIKQSLNSDFSPQA